jgi:hypothetical protein
MELSKTNNGLRIYCGQITKIEPSESGRVEIITERVKNTSVASTVTMNGSGSMLVEVPIPEVKKVYVKIN